MILTRIIRIFRIEVKGILFIMSILVEIVDSPVRA